MGAMWLFICMEGCAMIGANTFDFLHTLLLAVYAGCSAQFLSHPGVTVLSCLLVLQYWAQSRAFDGGKGAERESRGVKCGKKFETIYHSCSKKGNKQVSLQRLWLCIPPPTY
jgi:hypothetical protein